MIHDNQRMTNDEKIMGCLKLSGNSKEDNSKFTTKLIKFEC